jgi:hypothetical protein
MMKCHLLDLNKGGLVELTPGSTTNIDKYGRYDILCDMEGAEFVKFIYNNNKEHDGWQPPYVFSGVPEDDPGCNDQVKYLSGACGATCSGVKTVTAKAQQMGNEVCLEQTFKFKCGSVPTTPTVPAPTPTPPTPTPPTPFGQCDLKKMVGLTPCTNTSKYCIGKKSYIVYDKKYAEKGICKPICMDEYKIRAYAYTGCASKYVCECTAGDKTVDDDNSKDGYKKPSFYWWFGK